MKYGDLTPLCMEPKHLLSLESFFWSYTVENFLSDIILETSFWGRRQAAFIQSGVKLPHSKTLHLIHYSG